jgi:hypothetical protein
MFYRYLISSNLLCNKECKSAIITVCKHHVESTQAHFTFSDFRLKLLCMEIISLLKDKKILLGVTGSIACYKAIDLASKLTQAGALVDVILTEAAAQFVSPLAFRSVTGRPVHSDMWSLDKHVRHVGLGETADLLVIAPATAHTLAKLAHGLADNLLTVTALAARSMEASGATVRVIYPGYHGTPVIAQNSGYDQFPPMENDWRTIHPVPGDYPTTPG